VWKLALESLQKVVLRAIVFNSVRVSATDKKYKNPLNLNLMMDQNTHVHPLTEANGDFEKMKPLVGAWGIPTCPLATVTDDLDSMKFGTKHFLLGLFESSYRGDKTWTKTWQSRKVTSGMARGKVLVFGGRDETGDIVLKRMPWITFMQLSPKKRAPWQVTMFLRIMLILTMLYVLLCRPTFTQKGVYHPSYFRGKLCLFKATFLEGKDGYEASLKLEQNIELTDATKICGNAIEEIRLIQLACVNALKFDPMTVTDGIVVHQRKNEDVYVEARVKIASLQAPFIVARCPKMYVTGVNAGKQCLSPVEGGKCRRIHKSDNVGAPIRKLSAWVTFLDADLARSVQRRAYMRPHALSQITGIDESDLEAMTIGTQETVSKALTGQIFVGRFIIGKSFITCVSFTN